MWGPDGNNCEGGRGATEFQNMISAEKNQNEEWGFISLLGFHVRQFLVASQVLFISVPLSFSTWYSMQRISIKYLKLDSGI